jgi:hypothetical protein
MTGTPALEFANTDAKIYGEVAAFNDEAPTPDYGIVNASVQVASHRNGVQRQRSP